MSKKVLDALAAKFPNAVERTESTYGDEIAWIKRDNLVEVARWLRDDPAMSFQYPVFVTCIDRLDWRPVGVAPSEHWNEGKPRFEVAYQLRSTHNARLRLKLAVSNLLNQKVSLEQGDITVNSYSPGVAFSLGLDWAP